MTKPEAKPILIAGPTASGKSAFALDLAARHGGIIINADSMQVYRELAILTARPSRAEMALVPHTLYGHVSAAEAYSVARWLDDVRNALDQARAAGQRPIVTGGTGLYFKALLEGLSPVPPIPDDIRSAWRDRANAEGSAELHRILQARDPLMADRLNPSDTQRVTRALEVLEATGRSLAEWQRVPGTPLIAADQAERYVVSRPRDELFARCDQRFDAMMQVGAGHEVRQLASLQLDPALPAMQALGVRQLLAAVRGETAWADAIAQAKLETRQFVKRQTTWLKRNMVTWSSAKTEDTCEF